MKKRGFTLIEMVAVVLIMGLLTLIILPTIVNQIRSQRENISESTLQLIYTSNELYLEERTYEYPMYSGATYCVSLERLVNDGKLKSPVQDLKTGKNIPLNQVVKTVVNQYNDGEYELVEAGSCKGGIKNGTAIYYDPTKDRMCTKEEADKNVGPDGNPTETKTGCMKWYIFNDNEEATGLNIILDHNTTKNLVWNSDGNNQSMKEPQIELDKLINEFDWKVNPRLITADEIAQINGYTEWKSTTNTNQFDFGSHPNDPLEKEDYLWLYENTSGNELGGYYTSSSLKDSTNAVWGVDTEGRLLVSETVTSAIRGVRPVLTISKALIVTDPNTGGETLQYKEYVLNGTDPILSGELIPVRIEEDGTVKKADITKKWYEYANKQWANAVILKDKTIHYDNYQVIPEENIESYFVWIPKYSYQIWDLGEYKALTEIDNTKVHAIPIRFGTKNTSDVNPNECTTPGVSEESGNCKIGDYMTHPAFLAFNTNGFWVGKFETGYDRAETRIQAEVNTADSSKVIVKPNVYSWRSINIGNAFKTSYEYKRNLDSHMIKNTEWGAVAYLSHSNYGINKNIRINNNSNYVTGYFATDAAIEETTIKSESQIPSVNGTYTHSYYDLESKNASTTGNITGIYDMAGGAAEYVMGYIMTANTPGASSEITQLYPEIFNEGNPLQKYYDQYQTKSYAIRILGDATGELGPFQTYPASSRINVSSWYNNKALFPGKAFPWFSRGGYNNDGKYAGIFFSSYGIGDGYYTGGFRIVLSPKI